MIVLRDPDLCTQKKRRSTKLFLEFQCIRYLESCQFFCVAAQVLRTSLENPTKLFMSAAEGSTIVYKRKRKSDTDIDS